MPKVTSIEITFDQPVDLSDGSQIALIKLTGEICRQYETSNPRRVMWPCHVGEKITSNPMTLMDDEPIPTDPDTFHISCFERERFDDER